MLAFIREIRYNTLDCFNKRTQTERGQKMKKHLTQRILQAATVFLLAMTVRTGAWEAWAEEPAANEIPVPVLTEDVTEPAELPHPSEVTEEMAQTTTDAVTTQAEDVMASAFACSVTDGNGNVVFGYRAPQDGITYLFLPRTVDIASMELFCAGEIQGFSKGEWDPQTGLLRKAFRKSGDTIVAHLIAGDMQIRVLQSELPSLQLKLNQTTLAAVQQDKTVKFPGNSVYLTLPDGTADVTAENSVEFKGRGNTSWTQYAKKGYQIKFSEKTSVLGMKPAKKWILLANASDDSMMRNMLAMDLSRQLEMAYTTEYQYVDLWIDGDYQGTYIVGEKAEIGSSRLPLKDELGVLMELDSAFYMEEDYWFYDPMIENHFTVKESVEEDDENRIRYAMASFQNGLDRLMLYLYQTPSDEVTLETLSLLIDVDSFAKYYLITEYALNREANNSSFYWYKDGEADVLHLGPVWDFDTCMGNEDLDENQYYAHLHNPVMNRLLSAPAFFDRVKAIKEQYDASFKGLAGRADRYRTQIGSSAYMNYIRWNTLGGTNPKGYSDFSGTYQESVSRLKSWLNARYRAFAPQKPVMTAEWSADQTVLTVHTARSDAADLRLAVWSDENGQDDLVWLADPVIENGEVIFRVDLHEFLSRGLYRIHLYRVKEEDYKLLDATVQYRFV